MNFEHLNKITDDYKRAHELVKILFKDKKDKEGKPYIGHLERVCQKLTKKNTKIAGLLHDVVEDSDATLKDIEEEFGRYIRNCVEILTHQKEEMSYPDYIDLIMSSPLPEAMAVKHADMRDHLKQKETLTPKLKEKYFEVIDRFI